MIADAEDVVREDGVSALFPLASSFHRRMSSDPIFWQLDSLAAASPISAPPRLELTCFPPSRRVLSL